MNPNQLPDNVKAYISIRTVIAWPENRTDIATGEASEGYGIHYTDAGNNYESWCPKDVFDATHHVQGSPGFAQATSEIQYYKQRMEQAIREANNGVAEQPYSIGIYSMDNAPVPAPQNAN